VRRTPEQNLLVDVVYLELGPSHFQIVIV
jgi:hypothetical protein